MPVGVALRGGAGIENMFAEGLPVEEKPRRSGAEFQHGETIQSRGV
jgi:hypothetical protein